MKRLFSGLVMCVCVSAYGIPATGGPGVSFPWPTSEKQGVGTAFEEYDASQSFSNSPTAPISRVWYTVARGILTEVFYPRVDTAQTRDTQIVVTDGHSFLHQEQFDTQHEVERVGRSPLLKIRNRDPWKRYAIEKEIWADSDRDLVIQKIRIERFVSGLSFYLLHKPAAANTLFGDEAMRAGDTILIHEDHATFGGWQGVATTSGWLKQSVGYVGRTDGFTDLFDFKMDYEFTSASSGNLAMMGQLDIPQTKGVDEFYIYLGFGKTREEVERLLRSVERNPALSQKRFIAQWENYFEKLTLPIQNDSAIKRRALVESSVIVLKASEDKTYSGALVASLSFPWGEKHFEESQSDPLRNIGYHVIWPRDLYHMANAFMAIGDFNTVIAILNRLKMVQLSHGVWGLGPRSCDKKGSFPQNFWVDGKTVYGGYQADETAMPVLLAYQAWVRGIVYIEEYWPMVRAASDFLVRMGPWTQNERWEEVFGISPNSAAYVIAALVAASEIAIKMNDTERAAQYLALADDCATKNGDNIDTWTFTTQGKIGDGLGNGKYYLRIDGASSTADGFPIWNALWNPNQDGLMVIGSIPGPERFKWESEVIDSSFLALVRVGVRSALNYFVQESIPETDNLLKKDTPRGTGWYRYRFDGYGENHKGRLWPLLTGERIHYELQKLKESRHHVFASEAKQAPFNVNRDNKLEALLKSFESFASIEGIFSEQVWDDGSLAGLPTGSASPLGWTHAEYLQTLRSIKDGAVFEEISSVRERYGKL